MVVIGIDPGPESSAYVAWDGRQLLYFGDMANTQLLSALSPKRIAVTIGTANPYHIAIEQIRGFGVPAGNDTFDTCFWVGRFYQAWGEDVCRLVPRKKVIAHLCGTGARGNDRFVREALIDRIGEQGSKKQPGPTYGISSHRWAALALAVTWLDLFGASEVETP